MRSKVFFIFAFIPLLNFCGSSPTVNVNLSGAAAFADTNVHDVVFIIANVPGSGGGLDQNKDGTPDVFVFPSACGASIPANCGYAAHAGAIVLGDLPLNFNYKVTVRLRNTGGTTLHSGTATFTNSENSPAVNIAVN